MGTFATIATDAAESIAIVGVIPEQLPTGGHDGRMDVTQLRPDLTDGVVRLRGWRYDDLDCVREASTADGNIPAGTTVPSHFTERAGREFIERQWGRTTAWQGWSSAIATNGDDKALGCIVLMLRPQAGVAGIGYWLLPGGRRRGYGSRAVEMLTEWGLTTGDLDRVEAWVEPHNEASIRLLTRCGYTAEGRLRSFLSFPTRRADALVFSRIWADRGPQDGRD